MRFQHFFRAHVLMFLALFLTALAHAGAAIGLACSFRSMFDEWPASGIASVGIAHNSVLATALAVTALFVTTVMQRRLIEGLGLAYVHTLRLRLFRRLLRAAPIADLNPGRSNLLLPFVGDLTALRQWVGDGIIRLVLGSVTIALLLVYLTIYHPVLAAAVGVALGFLVTTTAGLYGSLSKATRTLRRRRGILSSFVAGRLEAVAATESMGRSRSELRKVARRSRDVYRASLHRAWLVGAIRGLTQSSGPLMMLLVLAVAAGNLGGTTLSLGEVLGLMSLLGIVAQALQDMGRSFELFVPGRVAMQRLDQVMSLPSRVRNRRGPVKRDSWGLQVNNLLVPGLSGRRSSAPITLSAAPGDVILLEGRSGVGKSALMAVLGRLSAPQSGKIRIDGADIATLLPAERQRLIGQAGPAVPLLPGSVGMNVKYRHPHAPHSAIDELMSTLCFADQSLDLGRKLVHPQTTLSSGQYQLVQVARALLGSPSLLLLDGIDNSLPPEARVGLAAVIRSYPGVVVMVARSSELRAAANRIWTVEDGMVEDARLAANEGNRASTLEIWRKGRLSHV